MRFQTHTRWNCRYFFVITKHHHLTLRFGLEKYPLFSERNQGSWGKWKYMFGKRLSWRFERLNGS